MATLQTPTSRFVADFVGRANFVRGTVRGSGEGIVVVEILGRTWRASAAPGQLADGAAVDVMVRPEEIHVEAAESGGLVPAVVRRASFVGAAAIYQLDCGGVELLASAQLDRGAPLHPDGARVGLRIRDEALRAFALAATTPPPTPPTKTP